MMTWEEMLDRYGRSGLGYAGIGTDEEGRVVIHTDLFVRRDGGGNEYLAVRNEFTDDTED